MDPKKRERYDKYGIIDDEFADGFDDYMANMDMDGGLDDFLNTFMDMDFIFNMDNMFQKNRSKRGARKDKFKTRGKNVQPKMTPKEKKEYDKMMKDMGKMMGGDIDMEGGDDMEMMMMNMMGMGGMGGMGGTMNMEDIDMGDLMGMGGMMGMDMGDLMGMGGLGGKKGGKGKPNKKKEDDEWETDEEEDQWEDDDEEEEWEDCEEEEEELSPTEFYKANGEKEKNGMGGKGKVNGKNGSGKKPEEKKNGGVPDEEMTPMRSFFEHLKTMPPMQSVELTEQEKKDRDRRERERAVELEKKKARMAQMEEEIKEKPQAKPANKPAAKKESSEPTMTEEELAPMRAFFENMKKMPAQKPKEKEESEKKAKVEEKSKPKPEPKPAKKQVPKNIFSKDDSPEPVKPTVTEKSKPTLKEEEITPMRAFFEHLKTMPPMQNVELTEQEKIDRDRRERERAVELEKKKARMAQMEEEIKKKPVNKPTSKKESSEPTMTEEELAPMRAFFENMKKMPAQNPNSKPKEESQNKVNENSKKKPAPEKDQPKNAKVAKESQAAPLKPEDLTPMRSFFETLKKMPPMNPNYKPKEEREADGKENKNGASQDDSSLTEEDKAEAKKKEKNRRKREQKKEKDQNLKDQSPTDLQKINKIKGKGGKTKMQDEIEDFTMNLFKKDMHEKFGLDPGMFLILSKNCRRAF